MQTRIAFIAHSFEHGGAENYLYNFACYCRKVGIQCLVIGPKVGPQAEDFRKQGVKVVPISLTSTMGYNSILRVKQFLKIAFNTIEISQTLSRFKPTVVYTNTSVIISGALASRILKRDHFWHIHENFDTMKFPSALGVKLLGKMLTKLSVKIIFPSRLAKNSVFPNGCEKTVVIPYGIDLSRFRCGHAPAEEEGPQHICFVGTLAYRKGIDVLLAALSILILERRRKVILDIWGSGDLVTSKWLKDQASRLGIREYVRFKGYAGNIDEILPHYDALAVPSRGESFSLVTIEAMASGVPVVATKCGGPEEIINDGVSGILVDVGDHRMLADGIEKILSRPADAKIIAAQARKKAVACFDAERQYRKILDCVLSTKPSLHKQEVSSEGYAKVN